MLAQYRREKKNIADSKPSGSWIVDVYKPKWFGYVHLNFLHGRDDANINSLDEVKEQLSLDIQEHTEHEAEESCQERQGEKFKAPKYWIKRRVVDEVPRIAHASSIMDNVNKQIESRKDDDDIFDKAIASKLRKIKDERMKILVQRVIDNILYDAILGIGKYSTTSMPSLHSESSSNSSHHGESLNCNLYNNCENAELTWKDL